MTHEIYETEDKPSNRKVLAPGVQVGSLVLLSRAGRDTSGNAIWLCRCSKCLTDKHHRADNLRSGRTKSCGCDRKARTAGRRNRLSGVLPIAGIPTRFEVYGYLSPLKVIAKSKVSECYGVVFVCDTARKDYHGGDRSKYYMVSLGNSWYRGGNEPHFMRRTMKAMHNLGWIGAQNNQTLLDWCRNEGVVFKAVQMPSEEHTRAQFAQQLRAAHIDFRGQVIG